MDRLSSGVALPRVVWLCVNLNPLKPPPPPSFFLLLDLKFQKTITTTTVIELSVCYNISYLFQFIVTIAWKIITKLQL